jgi:hypothetical protein|nr:MAG TPA: hypothetical protein [Caudoviricetes sp.]
MTEQVNHKQRLEGYWDQLFVIGKKWEEDIKTLRKTGALSKDEALSEGDILEHLWDYMEEVSTLADDIYEDEEDEEAENESE